MRTTHTVRWAGLGLLFVLTANGSDALGQTAAPFPDPDALLNAQRREKIEQIQNDKAAYAAAIVARWESSARESGKWDRSYSSDLLAALTSLSPENLLAAGEASSYQTMMGVLATGRTEPGRGGVEPDFGGFSSDLVYNPVTPCRIVDTRFAVAGALSGGVARTFDVDGASFAAQGGSGSGCGIPFGVATAVHMTIVAVSPAGPGYLTAWSLGPQPTSSVLNYAAGDVIANTATIPVAPGSGNDFTLFSLANSHVVVDVLGYYSAPLATALDCVTVSTAFVAAPVNAWTPIDAFCAAGRTATGGGYNTAEGTLGYPGVWLTSVPLTNGWRTWVDNQASTPRNIQTFVRCCRIPGR